MDTPIIAPFQADADTNGTGTVWFGFANEETPTGEMVAERASLYFNDADFVPKGVITITWEGVGYFSQMTDKVNTFQCVLATNGTASYIIYQYLDDGLNWYQANERDGVPAQVGFNKGCSLTASGEEILDDSGCGVYYVLEESMTSAVTSLDDKSNIPGASPGFYMWRVSSSEIVSGMMGCSNKGMVLQDRCMIEIYRACRGSCVIL